MVVVKVVGGGRTAGYTVQDPSDALSLHVRRMAARVHGTEGTANTRWAVEVQGCAVATEEGASFRDVGLGKGGTVKVERLQRQRGTPERTATATPGGNGAGVKRFTFPRCGEVVLRQAWRYKGAGTGSVAWDASFVLAAYLDTHLAPGGCVVELGAGLGLPSCVAAALCPSRSVVATDGDEAVLDLLQHNLARFPNAAVKKFQWGDEQQLQQLQRLFSLPEPPLVLAADVVYRGSRPSWPHLVAAIRALGGHCILAATQREVGAHVEFLGLLPPAGLAHDVLPPVPVASSLPQETCLYRISPCKPCAGAKKP